MNEPHWYERLHWRAFLIFFVLLIVVTTIIWVALGQQFPEDIRLIRRGLAAGVLGSLLAGIAIAFYTRRLVVGRLERARRRVRDVLESDAPELSFREDEIDLMSAEIIEGIAALRTKLGRLEQEKTRLSVLLSGMSEAVVMTDERERILVANPVAEKVLKLPKKYEGKRLADVCGVPRVSDLVAEVLWNQELLLSELDHEVGPNDIRHLSVSAAPIVDENEESTGAVVVLYDVTRLRRLEQVRRDFVANVSHELRTPIATIQSASETLLMESVELVPVAEDFVDTIFRNSNRMATIVEDLLTLSKLEAAGEEFKRHRVDLPNVVASVLDQTGPAAREAGVTIEVDLDENLPAVDGEPGAVNQILQNLVENAIKYTPEGGRVCIEAHAKKKKVIVRVTDTGIGIPGEHIHRIFERFYRVDEGRSRDVGGTGLGLAIVKHLVRKQGGDIDVESTPEEGTTFKFWLRIHRESSGSEL